MPLYEYECEACGQRLERIQKFSDPPLTECPACGGHLKKLVSSPAIQFKGSGWYVTDYARKDSGGGKSEGSKGESSKKESGESSGAASDKGGASSSDKGGGEKAEKKGSTTGAATGDSAAKKKD